MNVNVVARKDKRKLFACVCASLFAGQLCRRPHHKGGDHEALFMQRMCECVMFNVYIHMRGLRYNHVLRSQPKPNVVWPHRRTAARGIMLNKRNARNTYSTHSIHNIHTLHTWTTTKTTWTWRETCCCCFCCCAWCWWCALLTSRCGVYLLRVRTHVWIRMMFNVMINALNLRSQSVSAAYAAFSRRGRVCRTTSQRQMTVKFN